MFTELAEDGLVEDGLTEVAGRSVGIVHISGAS